MLQSFKLAIKSIISNKFRSFLTMLGIIIGVGAVIILVSIVSGYLSNIIESFESMGANNITIHITNLRTRKITDDQMYAYFDEHSNMIGKVSPIVSVGGAIAKVGSEQLDGTSIQGVSEEYADIQKYEIEEGRNLIYADIAGRSAVCVVGSYVAQTFFGTNEKALEEPIKINGKPFTIVGVCKVKNEDDFIEGGDDDFIWIPYKVATKMTRNGNINDYVIQSTDTAYTNEIVEGIEAHILKTMKSDKLYYVQAMSSIIKELNSQVGMLSMMVAGIAGISLLVAGIGVMNIMLVSVTERTREIGIRKALGARQSVIMQQFIIEASVTSSIGGIIGIIFGAICSKSVGAFMQINATPKLWAILLSFGVSVGIGLIFGYIPAKNAARLDPIEALRTD